MDQKDEYNFKSKLQEVVPSTRFGQALASLFFLKRHKKIDDHGRAPVVSRLRAQSTCNVTSSPSCNTMPFEVFTPRKFSTTAAAVETPSPSTTTIIRISSMK